MLSARSARASCAAKTAAKPGRASGRGGDSPMKRRCVVSRCTPSSTAFFSRARKEASIAARMRERTGSISIRRSILIISGRSGSIPSTPIIFLSEPARRRRRCYFVPRTAVGIGRSGRWKWRRNARPSGRRDSPESPSIPWNRIMSGPGSKSTARGTAATAATHGASWT